MDSYILSIFILIGGIILGIILLILNATQDKSPWKTKIKASLYKLDELEKSKDINVLKAILIEADKLLDFALENNGIKGENLGEKLKNAKEFFIGKDLVKGKKVSQNEWEQHQRKKNHYEKIWEAHKLRNEIAHNINSDPSIKEIKSSINHLRKTILQLTK